MIAYLACFALSALMATDTTSAPAGPVVRIDTSATQITITITGLQLAAGGEYSAAREERVTFTWPADGWMRGYRIDVLGADGSLLPRTTLHHAGIVNLARRQLLSPQAERLIAAGRETAPVTLPAGMGVPMKSDQPLIAYFMLVNPADTALRDVSLRFTVPWIPAGTNDRLKKTFPVFFDAKPADGSTRSFDVPPGISVTSAEFTLPLGGRMRAIGGHVHDYAVEIRLEDVQSGRTLARLRTDRDATGAVRSVEMEKFLLTRGGLRLEAGRKYRVVSTYDNPTCEAITNGAMAFMVGPFVPDDARAWPAVDPASPYYRADLASASHMHVSGHAGHAAAHGDVHAGHGAHGMAAKAGPDRSTCH